MSEEEKVDVSLKNNEKFAISGTGSANYHDHSTRNVFQVLFSVKPWVWLIGIMILSIAILLGFGIFNIESLQKLLPTPTAFAPGNDDDSLIIVADFDNRSAGKYQGVDPAQYIFEQISNQVIKDRIDIRVERLREVVDDNSVREIGADYGATLVVWGWYDSLSINPRIERITKSNIIYEERPRFSFSDPERIEAIIVTDLPNEASYLTFLTLGLDAIQAGELDGAFSFFTSAIEMNLERNNSFVDISDAFFYRAYIQLSKGNALGAIQDYDRAITLRPGFIEAYNNRGIAFGYLAIATEPPNSNDLICIFWYPNYNNSYNTDTPPEIQYEISYANSGFGSQTQAIYSIKSASENAIANFEMAIELDPEFVNAYYNRGVAYINSCQEDNAIRDFTKASELDPFLGAAYNNLGNIYVHSQQYQKAIEFYNKAIEVDQNAEELFYNRGLVFASVEDDYQKAIADFSEAIEINPDFISAYYARALTYSDLGDYRNAINDMSTVIAASPNDYLSYAHRADYYYAIQEYQHAVDDYSKAIEISPIDSSLFYHRAKVYASLGDIEAAIEDFTKGIPSDSKDITLYYNRGIFFASIGENEKAIADFTSTIVISPTFDWAYTNRGSMYVQIQQFDKAIADYSQAILLSPNDPVAYLNRAKTYEDMGNMEDAIKDYRLVQELFPKTTAAEIATERISVLEMSKQ